MRQLLLPPDYTGDPELVLRGERYHYLIEVLRARPGERIRGLDPSGRTVELELTSVGNDECRLAVHALSETAAATREPSATRITLFQCLPKGKRMDLIVRQATETGVSVIVPVLSRHTVPRYDERDWENKKKRWVRVIREAVQQCGRSSVPLLEEPIGIEEIPAFWQNSGPAVFFHETPLAHETLHGYLFPDAPEVALVIGPEGGLAPGETRLLADSGFGAVYLGENVLRVETATLFAIAAVRIVLLEKNGWKLSE